MSQRLLVAFLLFIIWVAWPGSRSVYADESADPGEGLYSVQPYLQERFDQVGRSLRFRGDEPGDVIEWQRQSRATLRRLIGLDTMKACELAPRVTERVDCEDYWRERVELHVEPGVLMPVYILIPKSGRPPYPVVLAPHGHGGGGKAAVAGVTDRPEIARAVERYNYSYGVKFCRAGFLVMCPDARGFGERQETLAKGDILRSSCRWINNMALPLGQTVTGMWVWDLMRLVDYAAAREDCDMARLGCAGLSGGGLQTLWVTALDERIQAAVVSGYFYGVKQALLDRHGNCSCNYVPRLWEHADHGDLGALIAPRPLLIQTGDSDPLNGADGLDNVGPQITIARRVYEVAGANDKLVHDVFPGPHRWDDTRSIPFLTRVLAK